MVTVFLTLKHFNERWDSLNFLLAFNSPLPHSIFSQNTGDPRKRLRDCIFAAKHSLIYLHRRNQHLLELYVNRDGVVCICCYINRFVLTEA